MTIPRECKRLAEVDFPIAAVSKHAVREKSIRHGHPSTLHLWWARRPLASSRAMLLALLLPDPCDPHCPPEFKMRAREALGGVQNVGPSDLDLQRGLLKFIGDFSNWDLASNGRYLEASRALVRAAYPQEPPLVVDPFAGGGSIPLEALRLACDAFSTDLNPVAVLILKMLLEEIPRQGADLANTLRAAAKEVRDQLNSELGWAYQEVSKESELLPTFGLGQYGAKHQAAGRKYLYLVPAGFPRRRIVVAL
jgi:putative DNA methylase